MMAAARPATWMFVVALMMSSTAYADPACDALNGERTFSDKCATCHSVTGAEPGPVGPNLANVVGRLPGRSKGFAYSDAMRAQRQRWTPERLDWFLTDPLGRVVQTVNPLGHKSTAVYDKLHRVTGSTDGAGNTVGMSYDAVGNLVSFTDARNTVTSFVYDAKNRLTTRTDASVPTPRSDSFTYDGNDSGDAASVKADLSKASQAQRP